MPITRPPNSVPGIGRLTDPVATMTVDAAISVPSNWPPTRTFPSSVTEACPSMTSMLFFLNSPDTPPVRVDTTFSRRAWTAGKSTSTLPTFRP